MRLSTILVLAGAAGAGGLMISASGPEAPAPAMVTISKIDTWVPTATVDELQQLPGWPVKVQSGLFAPSRGIALADFDCDGRPELIMPAHTRVHCWRWDGTPYPGWPAQLVVDSCQYAAAVADVDRDGDLEVAVSTRGLLSGGAVYLIGENGVVKPGWPFRGANGSFEDAPALADLDGDDTLEIIALERLWPAGKVHVLRHDGSEQPGWPQTLDHVPAAGAGVADLDGDGAVEIVAFSYNSIYVFGVDGGLRPGWPVTEPDGRHFSYQSPAIADLDGDDTLEVVTGMHQNGGACIAFRHDGTIQPGWPFGYASWTYCPPAACDLYRDGELKVVHGIAGGMMPLPVLYAFAPGGSLLPGFPYIAQNGAAAEGNPTVCDLDADGDMEIIFTSNLMNGSDSLGYLCAIHHDGSEVSGWPLRPYGFTYLNGATVADVNGDDTMDIIGVSEYAGQLEVSVWNAGVPFSRLAWEWPTYQFDMRRTGLYQWPTSGVAEARPQRREPALRVMPSAARAGTSVRLAGAETSSVTLFDNGGRQRARLRPGGDGAVVLPAGLGAGVYYLRTATGGRARLVIF